MRMKLFSGATMEDAMAEMRAELGPDAVILSTRNEPGCIEVRAAVERAPNARFAAPVFTDNRPQFDHATRERLLDVMDWHGVPSSFANVVTNAGIKLMGSAADPGPAMAAGLEGVLSFSPIHTDSHKSILLIGSPGSGKTSAAAKLARHTRNLQHGFKAASADFTNTGGHARLTAYTEHVDIGLFKSANALKNHMANRGKQDRQLVIDGPAFNPANGKDMENLKQLVQALDVEPILVISAEGHPYELADNARAFANIGIKRAIITKLDAVRRRGGIFSALSSARLSIAQLSLTHNMANGLIPATPLRIARLLLETTPEHGSGSEMSFRGAA